MLGALSQCDSGKPEKVPHSKKGSPILVSGFLGIGCSVFLGNWGTGGLKKILRLGGAVGGVAAARRRLEAGYPLYYIFIYKYKI